MRDKYEREIEELLEQLERTDQFVPHKPPRRGQSRLARWTCKLRQNTSGLRIQLSPGWLMAAGVALMLLSIFLRPVLHGVSGPLGLGGIALFFAAYLFAFRRQNTKYHREKRWRGRIIELPRRNSWRYKLSRWLRNRR
ncbi:MAG: hypothetical protein EPO21_22660 [Chloroflexota bacterium]|nr:MAG: hypothetical protein EPO21_22660 [Chloroflexota bacterium]